MSVAPWVRRLDPVPDPLHCCEMLEDLPCRLFLDSALRMPRLGRYSFLTADPVALIRSKGSHAEYVDLLNGTAASISDPIEAARAVLTTYRGHSTAALPPFQGGLAGFVSYDLGQQLERLPFTRYDDLALPDLAWGLFDWVIAWDHELSQAWLMSTGLPETDADRVEARAEARGVEILGRLRAKSPGARHQIRAMSLPPRGGTPPSFALDIDVGHYALEIRSSFTRDQYLRAVETVRAYIYAGDIFQANLSQRFEAPLTDSAWAFYRRLRARNQAPFAAFLDFPDGLIASASPERFLSVAPDGHVETRPIKGTRPRGLGPEHDAHLGRSLTESAKDQAENLMIVDLMRNDLSRVCKPGSVMVPELFVLERYATVHHLVSTVLGELATGEDALTLLRAAFPGGSITGAPKVRAMEIIAELEPSARGVYCGAIGYWSLTGASDCSVAIRTAVVREGRIYFSAGGGIVADSESTQEYRETLDKARGMIDSLTPHGSAHR